MSNQVYRTPAKSGNGWLWALAILAIMVALIFGVGSMYVVSSNKTVVQATPIVVTQTAQAVTVPGPTVTVTVQAPVTQQAASTNVADLERAWLQMAEKDKSNIRDGWRAAKGNATQEAAIVKIFMDALRPSTPTLTDAETRIFLDWTLDH